MEHMGIFDEICGDLGLGKDPHHEAKLWCIAEFKRLWTLDEKAGIYKKVCRVFFIPVKGNGYGSNNQEFWGREHRYDVHFALNGDDTRYLAPLGIHTCVVNKHGDTKDYHNQDLMEAIARKCGVDPQRLNFTEMIRDGVEIELAVKANDVENLAENIEKPETINSILSKDGWLGSFATHGQTKDVSRFLIWALFGVKIESSASVEEMTKALDQAVCPTLKAIDVERARFIRARVYSMFGGTGGNIRGITLDGMLKVVRQFDDMLYSIGVTPPKRDGEWKSTIASK